MKHLRKSLISRMTKKVLVPLHLGSFRQFPGLSLLLLIWTFMNACSEDEVTFNSTENEFISVQIQKFDYGQRIGVGTIYQGHYSENKDTIYFDVTYFPDETAPTYQDWQMQGTLYQGTTASPALGGIKDLKDPLHYTITAPDGKTKSEVVLVTRIYEVPYGELEHGFGRYNKLWNKTAAELGGWVANNQTSLAVVGDEIIVNNRSSDFLVYDKRTGEKKDKLVPVPAGNTSLLLAIATDSKEILHAATYLDAHTAGAKFRIYRWTNGLDEVPEIFFELSAEDIPTTRSTGMGRSVSICGDTHGDAQIMVALDGEGQSENRIVRISVVGGVPTVVPDIFEAPITWTWRGKGVATSPSGRNPYFATSLGSPFGLTYYDNTGVYSFVTAASGSNFLNKIAVTGAYYFEFNHAQYLAASTVSWSSDLRMLIFNIDDPSIIPTSKADNVDTYSILNPFSENWDFLGATNGNGTGDITVQVQQDGKSALVYMLDTNSGILAYELTNVGASGN